MHIYRERLHNVDVEISGGRVTLINTKPTMHAPGRLDSLYSVSLTPEELLDITRWVADKVERIRLINEWDDDLSEGLDKDP